MKAKRRFDLEAEYAAAYAVAGRQVRSSLLWTFAWALAFVVVFILFIVGLMGLRSAMTGETFECQLLRHVPGACEVASMPADTDI